MINAFTKLARIKPLKDKKGKTILIAFTKIANESNLNQINYGLIKEEIFVIDLRENG